VTEKHSASGFTIRFPFLALLVILYFKVLRPRMLTWGAEPDEAESAMNGDDLIPRPSLQATRAVNIDAPPQAVWDWLSQMGRDRTGFYGIDRLDNWGIPSVTYLRRDLAPVNVGMILDNGLKVFDVAPNRQLLFGGFDVPNDFGGSLDLTYLYTLEGRPDGGTRLVVRVRGFSDGLGAWLFDRVFEAVDFFAMTTQLRGIKTRAESPTSLALYTASGLSAANKPAHHWN
jgi:hypothetical protein